MPKNALLLPLVILAIGLSAIPLTLAESAPILSPYAQFSHGTPIGEIQCADARMLVESPSGRPACVYPDTVKKLLEHNWIVPAQYRGVVFDFVKSETVATKLEPAVPTFIINEIGLDPSCPSPNVISLDVPSRVKVGEVFDVTAAFSFEDSDFDAEYWDRTVTILMQFVISDDALVDGEDVVVIATLQKEDTDDTGISSSFETTVDGFDGVGSWTSFNQIYSTSTEYDSFNNYQFDIDSQSGNPAPSVKISGDGFGAFGGIQRSVDLSPLHDDDLFVGVDYRATANSAHSFVTNARLEILDDDGNSLSDNWLNRGGTLDTDWQTFVLNATDAVAGHDGITIRLSLQDTWIVDHDQVTYFDNFYLGVDYPTESCDAVSPTFSSATLNERTGVLIITFSELIDTTPIADVDLSKLSVSDLGQVIHVVLTGATIDTVGNSDTFSITLTEQQRQTVAAFDAPQLNIAASSVMDIADNPIAASADNAIVVVVDDTSTTLAYPTLTSAASDGENGFTELDGARGITTAVIGDNTYVLVASSNDDGIQIIDITDPDSPTAVSAASDGENGFTELDGARGITTAVIDDNTYVLVASSNDDGIQIIDITDPDSPTAVSAASDGENGFTELDGAYSVTTAVIGGSAYAIVTGFDDDGIQIIDITDPDSPTAVSAASDEEGDFIELDGARGITTAVIDDNTYSLVASYFDDGIQIIDITDPDSPTAVSAASDGENGFTELDGAYSVTTAVIGGSAYAIVTGFDDDGIQIIALGV